MSEIDRNVKRSTPEEKGDFKPLVFLMTDGKSTDDMSTAQMRWKRDYAGRANLVAIGIGPYAALEGLSSISPNVLRIEEFHRTGFQEVHRLGQRECQYTEPQYRHW